MTVSITDQIEADPLELARAGVDDFCRAIRQMRHNRVFWYYHSAPAYRFSGRPFQEPSGRWWWHVKPGFAWPIDYFSPIEGATRIKPHPLLLGWQYPTAEAASNSCVHINVIQDLSGYDLSRVVRKRKRGGIRRALRMLRVEAGDPADHRLADEACEVWNSHVTRTGWNRPLTPSAFRANWAELALCPGTTVVTARDPACNGVLCGWLIARALHDTIYIDTIASHTDRVALAPNDALIFRCLVSAAHLGLRHAHYSLKSQVHSLEAFKRSLGFVPHAFPSFLELRMPIELVLRAFRPNIYKRIRGDESWMKQS